ncbi:hypothetical protein MHC_04580 [Mycoplasma haemocanis str. Illinois]|uniref:Lipoprotein n=1 Tax=Mycoplasma haemocanis (strain Illinois) TaxID=1111676 RepID=H6N800_MYCHN|nr:hypothetical protein [Mycoplasma haemocanis]AEW45772.1 hypothetical protein MHC_04580 [Mycoplasma haemocanis str. Illinois]
MKSVTVLLLGGASATGVAAAAGGYYVLTSKNPTIKERFKNRKFIPAEDSKQWTEEFKSDSANIKASIEALKNATDENGGSKLKDWCESQMELDSVKNPNSLELAGKYCLIRDLASQLSRTGKTLLTNSGSDTEWKNTYDKRKNKTTTRSDVGLIGDNWDNTKQEEDLPKIKEWCEGISKEDFLASETKYDKLHKWCTKEGDQVD